MLNFNILFSRKYLLEEMLKESLMWFTDAYCMYVLNHLKHNFWPSSLRMIPKRPIIVVNSGRYTPEILPKTWNSISGQLQLFSNDLCLKPFLCTQYIMMTNNKYLNNKYYI